MLSVLSTGTLHLSEELSQARSETHRLIHEKTQTLDLMERRRRRFHHHMGSVARLHSGREDFLLKRAAFLGLLDSRSHAQVLRRRSASVAIGRRSAWSWLWRRKLIGLWRRAVDVSCRESLKGAHTWEVMACKDDTRVTSEALSAARSRIDELESLLSCERKRAAQLDEALAQSQAQAADLQATLKDSYVRQFEEAQQRQNIEQKFSNLVGDMQLMRTERENLALEVERKRKEMADSEDLHHKRELRLHEASGELSLAEDIIDDMTSSKFEGMRRFFEKYNLPGVLVSLFRKTIQLHSHTRSRTGFFSLNRRSLDGSPASVERTTFVTVPRGNSACSNASSSPCHSPTASPTHDGDLTLAEVRNAFSLHSDGTFSRNALHTYIESLHLSQVSASMVTQVILALLDIDLGEKSCDVSRFAAALASPPAWDNLPNLTALWGSPGEPAAAIVQTRRRSRSRVGTDFTTGGSQRKVTTPRNRFATCPGRISPR